MPSLFVIKTNAVSRHWRFSISDLPEQLAVGVRLHHFACKVCRRQRLPVPLREIGINAIALATLAVTSGAYLQIKFAPHLRRVRVGLHRISQIGRIRRRLPLLNYLTVFHHHGRLRSRRIRIRFRRGWRFGRCHCRRDVTDNFPALAISTIRRRRSRGCGRGGRSRRLCCARERIRGTRRHILGAAIRYYRLAFARGAG